MNYEISRKIRVRHYTKSSSAERILKEGIIKAGIKTHKVFVERARRKPLAPRDAEDKYGIIVGKGNAVIEFDVDEMELDLRYNPITKTDEYFIEGDVILKGRNPKRIR